jgi:membrane-bound lytic murein transglycosylase D
VKLFKTICVFSLFALLLSACSLTRNDTAIASAEQKQVPEVFALAAELPEPVGATGKTSWAEYVSGVKAVEAGDLLTAVHYFDLALGEIYAEQQLDSLGAPEDSVYYSLMPDKIISALESLYPRLSDQMSPDHELSMQSDFEDYVEYETEPFDSFEETPLDSAESVAIEKFLDSSDFSRLSLPVEVNERVKRELHLLTVRLRSFTEGSLSRKTVVDSMIYAKLRQRNMPEDLIYLALVESGYRVSIYSKAHAAGVWQFIPQTGRRYGLTVDFWQDTRYNTEAATDAALSYLSDLYDEFGDWYLAMASYNCGENRIRRLVKEGLAKNPNLKKISYWDLKLPRETMLYVPRIIAAIIIGRFPEHYSFEVKKQNAIPFDTVTIKESILIDKIGPSVGASTNTIRDLNPELTRWCTPPDAKSYTLRVPKGTREKFLEAYAKMEKTQLVQWQQYKVQKGDNIGSISRRFGLKPADIQAANKLSKARVRSGQTLIIPMRIGAKIPNATAAAPEAANAEKKNNSSVRTYVVRKGDNLSSISRRFGVSSQSLITWNNLQGNKVSLGQRLNLQDPSRKDESSIGSSYTVKSGDSLWDIAQTHNVTVQQLLDWNPGLDKKIQPGMKIKVSE